MGKISSVSIPSGMALDSPVAERTNRFCKVRCQIKHPLAPVGNATHNTIITMIINLAFMLIPHMCCLLAECHRPTDLRGGRSRAPETLPVTAEPFTVIGLQDYPSAVSIISSRIFRLNIFSEALRSSGSLLNHTCSGTLNFASRAPT